MCLPIYPGLARETQDQVIETLLGDQASKQSRKATLAKAV
jgi:hypothetical protein